MLARNCSLPRDEETFRWGEIIKMPDSANVPFQGNSKTFFLGKFPRRRMDRGGNDAIGTTTKFFCKVNQRGRDIPNEGRAGRMLGERSKGVREKSIRGNSRLKIFLGQEVKIGRDPNERECYDTLI